MPVNFHNLMDDKLRRDIELAYNLFLQGMAAWVSSGQILSKCLTQSLKVRQMIKAQYPVMTDRVIDLLVRLGTQQVHPQTVTLYGSCFQTVGHLPYDDQVRVVVNNEPVPVVMVNASGSMRVRSMRVREMKRDQLRQVFKRHGIASVADQRIALLAKQLEAKAKKARPDYTLVDGKYILWNPTVSWTVPKAEAVIAEVKERIRNKE